MTNMFKYWTSYINSITIDMLTLSTIKYLFPDFFIFRYREGNNNSLVENYFSGL